MSEVGLDSVLNDGVLKEIPFIGTIIGFVKTGLAVRDWLFLKKLYLFLCELEKVPQEVRNEMIYKLESDRSYERHVGEDLALILDRLDAVNKAQLIGRVFSVYCQGKIDSTMLQRLIFAIDKIPNVELKRLVLVHQGKATTWYDINISRNYLLNAGLYYVKNNTGTVMIKPVPEVYETFVRLIINVDNQ